ncbi:MAG: ATP-binding protein [Polaromonas sp.]
MQNPDDEERLLRSVAIQNAQSILQARQRVEQSLLAAKEGLEQKTAELALSLSMMRATLEASRDGILATDDAGRITGFNQQYVRMWGIPEDMLETRDHERVLALVSQHVTQPREFLDRVHEIYRNSPGESFDVLTRLDGRLYERTSTLQFIEGRNVGRVWVFRDITERQLAEAALRDETRVLELLNNTGTLLTSKLDIRALVQAVTDAATEISGAKFGAFFYNTVDDGGQKLMLFALAGASREDFERFGQPRATALFAATFSGAPPIRIEDVLTDPRYGKSPPHQGMPKGHPSVRSFLAVPVASGSGEVIGGLFFGHPVPGVFTERAERLVSGIAAQAGVAIDNARLYEVAKRAAQEREKLLENERAARSDAEYMSQMKDEFLAMLAHELRNPLAPLRNCVEILRRSAVNAALLEDTRATMDRQITHMTRLVDDLLDVSRISRGKLELRMETIQLAQALFSAAETSRPAIAERNHTLTMRVPDEPVLVMADLVRLSQAFTNLLNNAAKYTPEGGALSVMVQAEGEGVTVCVEDTGIGIPNDLQPRIFDMFVQGEHGPAVPMAQGGLGIGLTLVRKIVEMHGGSIRVESRSDGPGSRFVVSLPTFAIAAAPVSMPEPASQGVAAATGPQLRRIMVVDDNVDAATTLAQLLELMGHEVHMAHDGVGAVDAARVFLPDMIFMDIGMPHMDGYEACQQIRQLQTQPAPVIVALTGWGQEGDKLRAREAGFDHHFTKPVDPDKLEALAGNAA